MKSFTVTKSEKTWGIKKFIKSTYMKLKLAPELGKLLFENTTKMKTSFFVNS